MYDAFKDWLKSLESDLSKRIKESRTYPAYVGEVICNMERFYIWKKSGRDTTRTEGDVTIIQLAPLQILPISPIPIRVTVPGDWQKWYEEKAIMEVLVGDICRYVITREDQIIVETLTKDIKIFELDSKTFTRDKLNEPIVHINSQDNFADTLLVHPLQLPKLMEEKSFISKWSLPTELVNSKGPGFIGIMGGLSVYETTGISESIGLLYDKRRIKIRKTPLSIKFDNYDSPKILQITESLFAWSEDSEAIVKLTLKT